MALIVRITRIVSVDKSILHEVTASLDSRLVPSAWPDKEGPSMRIDIHGRGFSLTAPLLDHTQRRLRFALSRSGDRIKRVEVRLVDTNGPRGGADKFCRMQVYLQHAPPVLIEDTGADLYAVIDRVAERAGRNVAKHVDRLRENARPATPQPPASPSGAVVDAFGN